MSALQVQAGELLASGKAEVVIGYGEGTRGRVRPVFVRTRADVSLLVFDGRCTANLTVYLAKPEVGRMGKAAIVATPGAVRSLIQLIAEHQVDPGEVVVLAADDDAVTLLTDPAALEAYAAAHPVTIPPEAKAVTESLARMSAQERRAFWDAELSRCFKCYACRSACALCYCTRCITDMNQPQWVCVAPHALGVMEWHLNRAMHMAGRCVQCGSCTSACPAGIPIGLLAMEASRSVEKEFGAQAGLRCDAPPALSSFAADDRESFIL